MLNLYKIFSRYLIILFFLFSTVLKSQTYQSLVSEIGEQNLINACETTDGTFIIYRNVTRSNSRLMFKFVQNLLSSSRDAGNKITSNNSIKQDNVVTYVINQKLVAIAWIDYRNDKSGDVYIQLIDKNGILWNESGLPVCTVPGKQSELTIDADKLGNIIIAWRDFRDDVQGNIYVQKINLFGKTEWKDNGISVINLSGIQESPCIAADEKGGAFISWVDRVNINSQIYIQRIDFEGRKIFGEYGKLITNPETSSFNPRMFLNDNSNAVIFWITKLESNKIYSQAVTLNGIEQFGYFGKEISSLPSNQSLSDIIQTENNFYVIFTTADGELSRIHIQSISRNGFWNFGGGITLHQPCKIIFRPKILPFRNDLLVYWVCNHSSPTLPELFGQIVSADGEILMKENGVKLGELKDFDQNNLILLTTNERKIACVTDIKDERSKNIYSFEITRPFEDDLKIEDFDVIYYEGLAKVRWISFNEKPKVKIVLERKSDYESWQEVYEYTSLSKVERKNYVYDDNLIHNDTYEYRLRYTDPEGNARYSEIKKITVNIEVEGYYLFQNNPNPFNSSTKIIYKIPETSQVKITIYNSRAEELQIIFDSVQDAGTHEITFTAPENLSSGVYFYKIQAGKYFDVKKMIYTK